MPSTQWSNLNTLQIGRYAEYYAKMEFSSYGWEVYTSEVDDHGVDFAAKSPIGNKFYEVQVKSVRNLTTYVYIPKSKMVLSDDRLVCFIRLEDGSLPDIYIIPSKAWETPDSVLVDRPYGKGLKSPPEWGIALSEKKMPLIEQYRADKFFNDK